MDEREILALLEARSETALDRLTERYAPLCRQIAREILDSPEDAEECWNDALLRLWNSVPPVKPVSLSAYLCKIVRNEALGRLRREHAQKRGGKNYILALDELQECLPSRNSTEELVDALALRKAIEDFLWRLPPRDCEAFLQRYFYVRPVKEIAKALGSTRVAVSASLSRSRKKLSAYLTKEGFL